MSEWDCEHGRSFDLCEICAQEQRPMTNQHNRLAQTFTDAYGLPPTPKMVDVLVKIENDAKTKLTRRIADLEKERDKWRRRFDDACAANELQQLETDKDQQLIADLEREKHRATSDITGLLEVVGHLERERDHFAAILINFVDNEGEPDDEQRDSRRSEIYIVARRALHYYAKTKILHKPEA